MNIIEIVLFYLRKKSVILFLLLILCIVWYRKSDHGPNYDGKQIPAGDALNTHSVNNALFKTLQQYGDETMESKLGNMYERCISTEFFGKKKTKDGPEAPAQVHLVLLCYFVYPNYVEAGAKEDVKHVSVVTNVHVHNLDDLIKLALRWSGPISAAVLVNDAVYAKPEKRTQGNEEFVVQEEHRERLKEVDNWMAKINGSPIPELRNLKDRLSLHLVFPSRKVYAFMYPVNLLRNIASVFSKTDYMLVMNSDLIVSNGFYEDLNSKPCYSKLAERLDERYVFAIPTFQFCNHSFVEYGAVQFPSSKMDILELYNQNGNPNMYEYIEDSKKGIVPDQAELAKHLQPMKAATNEKGDQPILPKNDLPRVCPLTKYVLNQHSQFPFKLQTKWQTATKPYYMNYAVKFETSFIISRKHSPVFDEYFLDRQGLDLQMHTATLDLGHFKFVSVHDHFLFASRAPTDNNLYPNRKKHDDPFKRPQYIPSVKNMYVAKIHSLVIKKLEISKMCEEHKIVGPTGGYAVPASIFEVCAPSPGFAEFES
eukprot:Nk52_evm29s1073 gene=Nk52_evmTU29s1073